MKRKIIFVDDEKNILDGLRRMMHDQAEAWEMSFCSHPAQALELMRAEKYDAAIIDISMPGMTGLEMLSEIKSHSHMRDIEVIVLTGLQEQGIKRQALSLGASDLLNKPVLKDDLVARLRSVLRAKLLRDELAAQRDELEKQLIYAQRMELVNNLSEQAAHSLADVMAAIVWYSELAEELLESVTELNNDVDLAKDNMRAIQQSGGRAKQLLNYLVTLSEQPHGPWQRISVSQLVSDAVQVAQALAPRGFVIQCPLPEGELIVLGDPAQLFQLVLELVIFAIRQARAGSTLELHLARVAGIDQAGDPAEMSVALELRATASLHTTRNVAPGTNKLLAATNTVTQALRSQAIAQRITKLHKGSLVVSESETDGMGLRLLLPLAEAAVMVNMAATGGA